jgi:hypothetical protein
MSDCSAHRVPRAGLDPIDGPVKALAVVRLAVHLPLEPETVVLLLDHERCGAVISVVNETYCPDDVLEVVECLTGAAAGTDRVGAVVVASVRPGADELDPRDPDRWLEMSDISELVGIELVEWFVLGRDTWCPRDLIGEAPRW